MGIFEITIGDFLKNAGIVGMITMLELSDAKEGLDYRISENGQALWLRTDFAKEADWTDMYFKAFVKSYGKSTAYQGLVDKIEKSLEKVEQGEWKAEKEEKDDLKFINDKLFSSSYQSGFENIKDSIQNPDIYKLLKKKKLKEKMDLNELKKYLKALLEFLKQPLCEETFKMKGIIYNYINRFWEGKSFLLRADAKKDMRVVFEKEFSTPLKEYFKAEHTKEKDICIDCSNPINSKNRVSIAFMKDMSDDLSRKKSAFWNGKVDAYLCPVCAFVYALSPLGFQLIGNQFVFVNVNKNINELIQKNSKNGKMAIEAEKQKDEKYPLWFARTINIILNEKKAELSNVQIIVRGIEEKDRYQFNIINKEILDLLKEEGIKNQLQWLEKHPYIKSERGFLNIYEEAILNLLSYQKQYLLLNYMLKMSIENSAILPAASHIYFIQIYTELYKIKKENEEENIERRFLMSRFSIRESGYQLRQKILQSKGVIQSDLEEKKEGDECLRGTIYQLLNALSVKNEEKFMEIAMRMYCPINLKVPDDFIYMLQDKETFQEYGYAFIMGLKGSHKKKKEED